MSTFSARPGQVGEKWILIDAEGAVVGRLAALVAARLRGKHQPFFTPHTDCGDHVIVVNAGKAVLTGKKMSDKVYHRHTGWPGGIKSRSAQEIFSGKDPSQVIGLAVQRMMPGGALTRRQLKKLRLYPGPDHPHQAQAPEVLDLKALNRKNAVQ